MTASPRCLGRSYEPCKLDGAERVLYVLPPMPHARPVTAVRRLSVAVVRQIVDAFSDTDIVQWVRHRMAAEKVRYSRGRPSAAAASSALAASRRPAASRPLPAAATARVVPTPPVAALPVPQPADRESPIFYRKARDLSLALGIDYATGKRELRRLERE